MEYCSTLSFFNQKGKLLKPRLASIFAVGMMYDITSNESDSAAFHYLKK